MHRNGPWFEIANELKALLDAVSARMQGNALTAADGKSYQTVALQGPGEDNFSRGWWGAILISLCLP